MGEDEVSQLTALLRKLRNSGLVPPRMPYPVWLEIAGIFPLGAVEVLITKNGKDFLLTKRRDEYWNGWHIPGGFVLAGESFAQSCNRLALKELSTEVGLRYISGVYRWKDHPFGSPISIVCVCRMKGKPSKGRFFRNVPEDTISFHKKLVRDFLRGQKLS